MDFIDLQGASGAVYRFRRWPDDDAHPPIAGNFVLVASGVGRPLEVGMLDNLSEARSALGVRLVGAELFTRLNVARAQREAEHADLQDGQLGLSKAP